MSMRIFLFLGLLFGFFAQNCWSQKVFITEYAHQADLKVFVVDHAHQSDLLVYRVDYAHQVKRNEGLWFFTDYAHQSDLKVYFVDYAHQALWRTSSKKHLMFR